MATQPGIGLQFQPTQSLIQAPQQAISLAQLGMQQRKQRQLMELNQMPGMVEGGLYTDQGIMALSQIDPGLRDEAVQKRATILELQSRERKRQTDERKILRQEFESDTTDEMAAAASEYYSDNAPEPQRKQRLQARINAYADAIEKDGRAAKYGLTREELQALRRERSIDDILLALKKHGKLAQATHLETRAGARALAGEDVPPPSGGETPPAGDTVSLAEIGTEGPQTKPYTPPDIEGTPLSDRPEVDDATFEKQASEWDAYEQQVSEAWQRGDLSVDQYEKELAAIDAEKEHIQSVRADMAKREKPPTSVKAPEADINATPMDDLIAKARDAETKAKKLRATGMPANIKQAEAYDKQAKKYRDQAQRDVSLDQKERALDQADKRIQIALDRAVATQSALPEDAVNFVAEQIMRGNAQAGAGLARNQVAKAQIISAYTRMARERGMSPGDVNAAINEFQGLQQAARTLGARSANIDVAAEELAQFIGPAEKASAAVPRTNFVPINRLIQLGDAQWSPEQAAFVAANRSVINAFAALASRGVPTVHGTEEAEKMLSTAQTHEQYQAVLKMLWQEAQAAIQATKNVRKHVREAVTGEQTKPQPYPGGAPPVSRETPKATAPMFARNPKTGERIESRDGGKTWQPVK